MMLMVGNYGERNTLLASLAQIRNRAASPGADMAASAALGYPTKKKEKAAKAAKMEKCGLPGCEVQTSHRGGYCTAEHCRKHREMQKVAQVYHG